MKLNWRKSEIIAFLEDCIADDTATEEMEIVYQDYKWSGKIDRNTYEWECVVREMKKHW